MSQDYRPRSGYRIVMEEDLFDLQNTINEILTEVTGLNGYVEFIGSPVIKKAAVFQALTVYYFTETQEAA